MDCLIGKTTVSVIIPTYNCAKYLSESINSILRQTYQDFELIVIDDGSQDITKELVANYIKEYPSKIKYFYQKNKGLPAARNAGIEYANGRYIAFLDADDELTPNALEQCISRIINTDIEWCIVDIDRVENGISKVLTSNIPGDNYLLSILNNPYNFIKKAFFFSKKMLIDMNFFNVSCKVLEDWDLYIRLIEADRKFVYINEPLYVYKIRKNSLVKNNEERVAFYTLKILEEHHKRLIDNGVEGINKIYAQHMWGLARRHFYELGDFKQTIYCIKESVKYDFSINRIFNSIKIRIGS